MKLASGHVWVIGLGWRREWQRSVCHVGISRLVHPLLKEVALGLGQQTVFKPCPLLLPLLLRRWAGKEFAAVTFVPFIPISISAIIHPHQAVRGECMLLPSSILRALLISSTFRSCRRERASTSMRISKGLETRKVFMCRRNAHVLQDSSSLPFEIFFFITTARPPSLLVSAMDH